jgi:hypothetical protein
MRILITWPVNTNGSLTILERPMKMTVQSVGLLEKMKFKAAHQIDVRAEDIVTLCEVVNSGVAQAVSNYNSIKEIEENQVRIYNILKKLTDNSKEGKISTAENLKAITKILVSTGEAISELNLDMDGVYEDLNGPVPTSSDVWVRQSLNREVESDDSPPATSNQGVLVRWGGVSFNIDEMSN